MQGSTANGPESYMDEPSKVDLSGEIQGYYSGMRPFWHPVAPSDLLSEGPVPVELLGQRLVLARFDGGCVALDDLCRHLGAQLSLGEVTPDGCALRCPYHGWSYNAQGKCVDIPARPGKEIPREARVRSYPVREAYGLVWVCLEGEPRYPIPEFPEYDDEAFSKGSIHTHGPWAASAPRITLATLDDTHFPWVHPGILGDPDHPEPPDHRCWHEAGQLVCAYEILEPASVGNKLDDDGSKFENISYLNHITPNTIKLRKESSAGTLVIWQAVSPISHDRTLIFRITARDYGVNPDDDAGYEEFSNLILEQDRPIVEGQRPWLLPPMSSRMMLYVRPADLPLIAYQKWLEELGIPQI